MRLFIAVNFSPDIKETLLAAIDSLRNQSRGNFTRRENLHLTLAFIGESRDISSIRRCMDGVSVGSFELTVGGCGRFGDLWWAGVEKNRRLEELASQLQNSLRCAGFDIETRPFKPHITLARRVQPFNGRIKLSVPRRSMTVGSISLMKSERINGRLTYTEIYSREL